MFSGLEKDRDGGLTIYMQKNSPGPDKECNWLPAPNAPFFYRCSPVLANRRKRDPSSRTFGDEIGLNRSF
jgi:hypothetical protein